MERSPEVLRAFKVVRKRSTRRYLEKDQAAALAALREAGDPRGASEALERAAACQVGGAAAERLTRAAALAAEDAERAAELLARAVACATLGRHADAEEAATRALDLVTAGRVLEPGVRLASGLAGGRSARELGHLDAAVRLLRGALEGAPADPSALAEIGEVLCELADWPAARDALERRLALPAGDAERAHLLALLGAALDGAGDAESALARFDAARDLDPAQDAAHAGLVDLLERSDRLPEAIAALCRWAERAGRSDDRAARLLRASELELRVGERAAAEARLRDVLALAP